MKRFLFLVITLLVVLLNASAQYTTAGDGTRYTLQKLSEIEESGVEKADNGESGEFLLTQTVTIAAGDQFQLDEDATAIRFSSGVALTIQGTADFQSSDETTMLADDDDESAIGISIENTTEPITLSNIRFERVGLRALDAAELYIQNCTFFRHDGSQAAALYFTLGTNKAVVNECVFEECRKAAVGSSVSAQVDLTLTDCYLSENSTMNQNVPQINLSASPHIVIDNCEIQGTPQNNMVGGIGISNFTMKENTHITIANCVIRDNRYGIGTMGPMQISITSNQLIDNCHETNPMNGGSGISLYDPYSITSARISQNLIEGSLWGITVIGCKDVNIGRTDVPTTDENYNAGGNIFRNNGNGGHRYDLYNNSANTVYAQGNTWNVSEQTQENIEEVITHKHDNSALGEVFFWPAGNTNGIGYITNQQRSTTANHNATYDLSGRTTTHPKGLYIKNGKKLLHP